ncbi:acyl carrier protein [Sphingobium bisphenolivorans]|uniref:acyl carrier protein n=1 Tax=Sphingobium bisphenolivorans TaxID=1335760 RepID=UPI0003A21B33|nr:phosphopantetheine-binding protein [Sphingobium bisphenolivorans]
MRAGNSQLVDQPMNIETRMRSLLRDVLSLSQERVDGFNADTPLFGALPELDSMAVAGLLTEMEDRFDILIEDDDIDGDTFETFGTLVAFAKAKVEG